MEISAEAKFVKTFKCTLIIIALHLSFWPAFAIARGLIPEPCGPEGCGGGGLISVLLVFVGLGGLWLGWQILISVIGQRYMNTDYYKNKVAKEKEARNARSRAIAESFTYEMASERVEEGRMKAKENPELSGRFDTDIDATIEWMNRWRTEHGLPPIVKPEGSD